MINLFAKFGFERLKAWAGGDQLSELPRNSNVLNIRSIKYRNNLDSIFIANKTIVLLHPYQCWSDVSRRLPIIGRLWCTASKQLVAPRCTSIRCGAHESWGWRMCPLTLRPLQWFQGRRWKLRGKCFRLALRWNWATVLKYFKKDANLYYRLFTKLLCMASRIWFIAYF